MAEIHQKEEILLIKIGEDNLIEDIMVIIIVVILEKGDGEVITVLNHQKRNQDTVRKDKLFNKECKLISILLQKYYLINIIIIL